MHAVYAPPPSYLPPSYSAPSAAYAPSPRPDYAGYPPSHPAASVTASPWPAPAPPPTSHPSTPRAGAAGASTPAGMWLQGPPVAYPPTPRTPPPNRPAALAGPLVVAEAPLPPSASAASHASASTAAAPRLYRITDLARRDLTEIGFPFVEPADPLDPLPPNVFTSAEAIEDRLPPPPSPMHQPARPPSEPKRIPPIPAQAKPPTYQQLYFFHGRSSSAAYGWPEPGGPLSVGRSPGGSVSPAPHLEEGLAGGQSVVVRDVGIQTLYFRPRDPDGQAHHTWQSSAACGLDYVVRRYPPAGTRDAGSQADLFNQGLAFDSAETAAERRQRLERLKPPPPPERWTAVYPAKPPTQSGPQGLASPHSGGDFGSGLPPPLYMDSMPDLSYSVPRDVALYFSAPALPARDPFGSLPPPTLPGLPGYPLAGVGQPTYALGSLPRVAALPDGSLSAVPGSLSMSPRQSPRPGRSRLARPGDWPDNAIYMDNTLDYSVPSQAGVHYWRDVRLPSLEEHDPQWGGRSPRR
eukprot:EG_transcript_4941